MSKVHIARQGLITKSAIPSLSRTFTGNINVNSSLLLLGSGANGGTTFTDSSVNNFTVTRNGSVITSTAQFPTGMSSSIYIPATNSTNLNVPNNSVFNYTNQDFCQEMYIYWISGGEQLFRKGDFNLVWYGTASSNPFNLVLFASSSGSSWNIFSGSTIFTGIPRSQWVHLALTREGSSFRGFVNGTLTNTLTNAGTIATNTSALTLGNFVGASPGEYYISNFRITLGAPVYTANFTPPALPLPNSVSYTGTTTVTNNTYGVYQNY